MSLPQRCGRALAVVLQLIVLRTHRNQSPAASDTSYSSHTYVTGAPVLPTTRQTISLVLLAAILSRYWPTASFIVTIVDPTVH
ncbi:hypothetical protein GMORB2_0786 [Geosmithia morbida]|uniref:Uncharacterized protein n=1 Tax=Geosmithia morbida TaxID=1094350 RepID=A0A9P4Z180_9HYPO|nr:uncharacterized protein GMORB2_0786 [Geosmithia morbida]KAF4125542.1 hypothetical protein GMORB2_0786 [Geosmithia morbida]